MKTNLLIVAVLILSPFARAQDCADHVMVSQTTSTPVNAESFFWKIQKQGVADSYLAGTYHTTNGGVRLNWEALPVLFSELKVLMSETDFAPSAAQEYATRAKDTPLAQAMQLAQAPGAKSVSVDAWIAGQTRGTGLRVVPVQSMTEMIDSLLSVPQAEQARILRETECSLAAVREQAANLEKLYVRDRAAEFAKESERLQSPHPELVQNFSRALLAERNALFAERARPLLEQGGALLALGASHLSGQAGLVARLRAQGFTVTPLNRAEFLQRKLDQFNERFEFPTRELLSWLTANGLAPAEGYVAPRIELVPGARIAQTCEDDCDMTSEAGKILISLSRWQDATAATVSAQFLGEVLVQLIRDVQMKAAGADQSCVSWNQRNVQAVILQGKFLIARHMRVAGLRPPPNPVCQ